MILPKGYTAGLDFLKLSLHLDWIDSQFMKDLHDKKASFGEEDDSVSELPFYLEGGLNLNIQRKGADKYPFVLKSGDVTLMFSNHKSDAQFPNCRIEIGSMSCWDPGWAPLIERILSWLRVYGAQVRKQKISEFHIAADLLGLDFSAAGFQDISRWIARANEFRLVGKYRRTNYIAFGKGNFMMRIYDKTEELSPQSPKEILFHGIWARKLNTLPPQKVTRVEFQCRRKVSKELQIETIADLKEKQNAIWEYCTSQWCRFTEKAISEADRDNKNQQRYDTAKLWEYVQAIKFDAPNVDKIIRRRSVPQHIDISARIKQAAGNLLTVCAAYKFEPDDYLGHISLCSDLIEESLTNSFQNENKKYQHKIKTKSNLATITF
jgi:hypothetical protein